MSEAPVTTSPTPARPARAWGLRLLVFFLVVLNGALGAGGYWLWQQAQRDRQAVADSTAQLAAQQQTLQQLQKQQAEQAESESRFRRQTIDTLKENGEKLRNLDRIDTSYWRLAEAEFLLKQAHQRLFITHDAETADLLLASADAAIMQQKDPSLLPVRSAIATDRAALRKVPRVDRDGIYLRLQALSSQVGMLTSENRFLQMDDAQSTSEQAASYTDQLWQRLMSIVRIRHHDHVVEPLLPPEQEVYLRQNLQLALVQAQLGLMQAQQQTYATNLERVSAWVNQYCQTEDPVVKAWLDEVQVLMRTNIAPELPDISASLRSVQKVIEQRAEAIQRALMMEDDENSEPEDTPAAAAGEGTAPATPPAPATGDTQ